MDPKQFSKIREAHGYTQPALAEKIDVSLRTIASWESGERKPPIDKLEKLADLYRVSTDTLLGRNAQQKEQPAANSDELRAEIVSLLDSITDLSDQEIALVRDFVSVLREHRAAASADPHPDQPA